MEIPDEFSTHPDPPAVAATAPVTEAVEEAIEDETDEIRTVAEDLAVHSVISEERHEEILECLERVENRLNQQPSMEVLESIRADLANLRVEVRNLQNLSSPSLSVPSTQHSAETPVAAVLTQAPVTVNPNESDGNRTPGEPLSKPKKRRWI